MLFGLTRETTGAEVARAALEGVAFQVADLIEAAEKDTGRPLEALRVDGGMARNAAFLQFQADSLGMPVVQAAHSESTALGSCVSGGPARRRLVEHRSASQGVRRRPALRAALEQGGTKPPAGSMAPRGEGGDRVLSRVAVIVSGRPV